MKHLIFTSCASVALNKEERHHGADEEYYQSKYRSDNDSIPYSFAKEDFIDLNAKYKAITEDYIKDICIQHDSFKAVSLRPSVVVGRMDNHFLQPLLRGDSM